jgi:hypothetical protein
VSLGFVYGSRRAHKAFWPTTMKNRGSLSPSSAPAIPDNIRPVGGRRPVGNGSGTEPRPRGFQFGAAGGWNLTGTDCPRWWGSVMEKKSAVEWTKGRRCSSSSRRGMTWLEEARGCSGWIGGGRKAADDDELLVEEGGVRCWRLRGWSVARHLADIAEPARGGRVFEAVASVLGVAARQGRALDGCLREERSREEAKGNSAPTWQLCGDMDATRTWRWRLHGLRVERRRRRGGYGPSWATCKRVVALIFF